MGTRLRLIAAMTAVLVGQPALAGAVPAPTSGPVAMEAPVLTDAKVKPKVLPVRGRAVVVVTSSEAGVLLGTVLLKQDGRWNRTTIEREWPLSQGRNERTFLTRDQQSLLVEGSYRLRVRAVGADGDKSARVVLPFEVDLRR